MQETGSVDKNIIVTLCSDYYVILCLIDVRFEVLAVNTFFTNLHGAT